MITEYVLWDRSGNSVRVVQRMEVLRGAEKGQQMSGKASNTLEPYCYYIFFIYTYIYIFPLYS